MVAGYTKTVCVPSGNNRKAPRINYRLVDDVTSEKADEIPSATLFF